MKRKNLFYLLLVVVNIIYWSVYFGSCNAPLQKSKSYLYYDYDLFAGHGIKELKQEDLPIFDKKARQYVELKYKANQIDSIIVFNLTEESHFIKVIRNNSNVLYKITVPDEIFGDRNSFLLFDGNSLTHYSFLNAEPYVDSTIDCQITKMTKDISITVSGRVKQLDTIDISNRLISGDSIMITQKTENKPMRKHLTNELTLLKYLTN